MSKRIIISGRERILNPFISFIMSFFVTGMGEVYSGSTLKGIILVLIRSASVLAIPFYSLTSMKSSLLTEVFFSLLFFACVTIISPFSALAISHKKKKTVVSKFNAVKFIILFALFNFIITLISVAVFFSFFSIVRINRDYPPIVEKDDIVVIKKIVNLPYTKGEMIVLKNENFSTARIIAHPGENAVYRKGRFSVQGSELPQSIFTENELKEFSLTDFNVISESNGSLKYPVLQNRDKYDIDINLKNDEYFAAPDDRNDIPLFATVKDENIYGKVEGFLFSVKKFKFLIKPFLDAI